MQSITEKNHLWFGFYTLDADLYVKAETEIMKETISKK